MPKRSLRAAEQALSISQLTESLNRRAGRAVLATFRLRSAPLRAFLSTQFEQQPGKAGSFLSDPVIEANFGYEVASETMSDLAGSLLAADLVEALDTDDGRSRDQRFPRDRHPYVHQLRSWRAALDPQKRGYVVSSGTGSGKTECFLIPILDDLVRESAETRHRALIGTRALFLYPLNALINSQRDRLAAWTRPFGGRIRFCLYNGETKETVRSVDQSASPEEILSRELLRKEPAPILVTNATMLEYMLVRQQDEPILEQSRGKLRWIVIDEAHTYVGSQAAELSMLMRRVLHAFGVSPADVKFVATSATLGGSGEAGREALARFVADVAGASPDQVEVIAGKRFVPPIDLETDPAEVDLPLPDTESPEELYGTLTRSSWFRELRQNLSAAPRTLRQLLSVANSGRSRPLDARTLLGFLDRAARARKGDELLLPLRAHLFHRTQNGVWACINRSCEGRRGTAIDVDEWPFGSLMMQRRETCTVCEARVFELVHCSDCGSGYLTAVEKTSGLDRFLVATPSAAADDDEFDLIDDEEDEEPEEAPEVFTSNRLLPIEPAMDVARCHVDPGSGELLDEAGPGSVEIDALIPEDGRFRCAYCDSRDKGGLFRPLRVGAPLLLNVAIPTLLESTPALASGKPMDGRRIITFSDSRQGTARFAVRSQLDADRNHVRSAVYHQVLSEQRPPDPERIRQIEDQLRELSTLNALPIKQLIADKQRELEALRANVMQSVAWNDLAGQIQHDIAIREWASAMWEEVSLGDVKRDGLGHFYLLREFARRPRHGTSLETMGLVSLTYPEIDRIADHQVPSLWKSRGADAAGWRDFLTAIVDHFIRANSAVLVTAEFINWLGASVRTRYLVPPEQEAEHKTQVRWPSARSRSPIVNLLVRAMKIDLETDRPLVDEFFFQAWYAIRPMLSSLGSAGWVLNLAQSASLQPTSNAFVCPVTRRVLSNTLSGLSPYALATPNVDPRAQRVVIPRPPVAGWRDPSGRGWSAEQITEWVETTPEVSALRSEGLWTDIHDRVVAGSPFFRVVEHSAQQDGGRLRDYEERFREGEINVMSCSTTMEMGVDISGVSAVAMNNAPPGPSNFLQRAGRAGRRQEPTTASLTLCKADPHGEAVFANPLWPFTTPIFVPRVSLESVAIVQRHVNAFLLGSYLKAMRADAPALTAGWFFREGGTRSAVVRFVEWLKKSAESQLTRPLGTLLTGTAIGSGRDAVEATSSAIANVRDSWSRELQALDDQIVAFAGPADRATPAQLAAERQRERLVDEYLLRELTTRGFLPGHGFPSNVVPFIPTTLKQLRSERARRLQAGREDFTRRRGYPSRDVAIAIRDYAPGNQTVIDGRVYMSEGVTLNWHIPPGDTPVRETQVFSQAWLCRRCGTTGASAVRPEECVACHESDSLVTQTFLQPAGFAVDIGYQPHNRLDDSLYVPVEEPWITSGAAEWQAYDYRLPLRIRSNTAGHVFHYSRGLHRAGFTVCLRCGRAESVGPANETAPLRDHMRLRGGKEPHGRSRCEGNDQTWAIKSGIWLGASTTTDVFEMQVANGASVDASAAYSLAIVLRDSLAAKLGIEQREIGAAAIQARGDADQLTHSIVLFDRAALGAGYATEAPRHLAALLSECAGRLDCMSCDRACQRCLLTYETQFSAARLDRMAALRLLGQ